MTRALVGKAKTAFTVIARSGYYLGYKAITELPVAGRFAKTLADAVTNFGPPQPLLEVPAISLDELWPGIEDREVSLTARLPKTYELPSYESCCIAAIVDHVKPTLVFEIGTHRGRTTRLIAEHQPDDGRIYTLNLPPERLLEGQYVDHAHPNSIGEEFRHHRAGSKVTQLFGNSLTFDFSPFDGRADLVFVDGDHCYETVRADTHNALRMIRAGGVIVWDDYHMHEPGVVQCLNELRLTTPVWWLKGTRLACYRAAST